MQSSGAEDLIVVPPLKWAGGKRWAVKRLRNVLPKKYGRYFEPFIGGGAAFFSIAPAQSVISDTNEELIVTYKAIRENAAKVWRLLTVHSQLHSARYYYKVRSTESRGMYERAARLLYLNRTCWNGLYRVNQDGVFNVPIGTKSNVLMESDRPNGISSVLQNAELLCCDFEMVIEHARRGDVVYADPPYTVKHNLNGFLKYNESIFNWSDQERLAECLRRARSRGAFVIVSNANHESIRKLYKTGFHLNTVYRTSVISATTSSRGRTSELLIVGKQ